MKKLRARLADLKHSLGVQKPLHARAVRRMKARHAGQKKAERQAAAVRAVADRIRVEAHRASGAARARKLRKAERKGEKAARFDLKAEREKSRAVVWRGRARRIAKRIAHVDDSLATVEGQIARIGGPTVSGNTVSGGDEFDRWLLCLNTAAANCATGRRRNEYRMGGSWDIDHPLVPGEAPTERSDCSETQTAFMKACGFDDINEEDWLGGFTGTMLRAGGRWTEVSLEHMLAARRPAVIIYGTGNGHHTEGWCPSIDADGNFIDAMRTVGHGSAPVDAGTVYLFGTGETQRYFLLAAK